MNAETVQRGLEMRVVEASPSPTALYVHPRISRPLRIVLVAPRLVPQWLMGFVQLAGRERWIDLVVQPVDGDLPVAAAVRPPFDVRAYLALDRMRHPHGGTMRQVAIESCAGIDLEPALPPGTDAGQSRSRIQALQPDLLLLMGAGRFGEAFGDCAPRGCWTLDASLTDAHYGGLSLLQSVLRGEDSAALELQLASGDAEPVTLATGWGTCWPGSFNLHRDEAFLKLPAMLLRVLRRLADDGSDDLPAGATTLRLAPPVRPLRLGAGLRAFVIALRRIARWQLQKRRPEDPWFLLLRHDRAPLDPAMPRLGSVSALVARKGEIWADPCVVDAGDVDSAQRQLVFVEEMPSQDCKADIACLELLPDGTARRLGIALEEPFHLSYPQAFRWDGAWYLTVESGAARRVSLYRARAFPLDWERITDLIEGCVCVDPTLHHQAGRWYLFVDISECGGSTCDELFLFVADALTGPFRPHPLNPIVTDVRRARPAGRLFEHGGRLIRPSQDCAASYGAAIVFNEVLELSPTAYRERALSRLDASGIPGLNGCHTYSAVNGIEVLDARGQLPAGVPRMVIADAASDPGRRPDCARRQS